MELMEWSNYRTKSSWEVLLLTIMHFYSTIANTHTYQTIGINSVLQILWHKIRSIPEIGQWETARQAIEEKTSERNVLSLVLKIPSLLDIRQKKNYRRLNLKNKMLTVSVLGIFSNKYANFVKGQCFGSSNKEFRYWVWLVCNIL